MNIVKIHWLICHTPVVVELYGSKQAVHVVGSMIPVLTHTPVGPESTLIKNFIRPQDHRVETKIIRFCFNSMVTNTPGVSLHFLCGNVYVTIMELNSKNRRHLCVISKMNLFYLRCNFPQISWSITL
ncbi:hypothetical protein Acj61p034 [Acinetobacter phage Acj61]|uniref:Uncharacterized protein n=1 Tax=Acinetobacter phage Acj61 TaxID=760732 RepID=E5E415_9CAUD|nr:hypothetical protein Acj61p034 [Acinetobacter phage Acj61]ADG35999.1 hypothetical protein Acj61p034 [Acinetobacter phage Acj61]